MIQWSVVAGVIGVLGAWFGMIRLHRLESHRPPEVYWLLGMGALFPAWLIAFLGLLGRMTGRFPEMSIAVPWLLSASGALLGVLVTDAAVKRLHEAGRGHRPTTYWLLGMAAICPAWCIGLVGLF